MKIDMPLNKESKQNYPNGLLSIVSYDVLKCKVEEKPITSIWNFQKSYDHEKIMPVNKDIICKTLYKLQKHTRAVKKNSQLTLSWLKMKILLVHECTSMFE